MYHNFCQPSISSGAGNIIVSCGDSGVSSQLTSTARRKRTPCLHDFMQVLICALAGAPKSQDRRRWGKALWGERLVGEDASCAARCPRGSAKWTDAFSGQLFQDSFCARSKHKTKINSEGYRGSDGAHERGLSLAHKSCSSNGRLGCVCVCVCDGVSVSACACV